MATREFHDFDDKSTLADIEAKSSFEGLYSKSGETGANITIASLKNWILTGDVGAEAQYNIKSAVDTLKGNLTDTVLTVGGKTLTSGTDKLTSSVDLYVGENKLAQEGENAAFGQVTGTRFGASGGTEDYLSLTAGLATLKVGGQALITAQRVGTTNSLSFAGSGSFGTNSVTAGDYRASGSYSFLGNEASISSVSGPGLLLKNAASGGGEVTLKSSHINFSGSSSELAGSTTLLNIETDESSSADPAEIRFNAKGEAFSDANARGHIKAKGDDLSISRAGAKISVQKSGDLVNGKIILTAPSGGVNIAAGTNVNVPSSSAISWRYATSSQDGLMSAAQAAEIAKIASIEEANGSLTWNLGFQSVSDGTNQRTATSSDRVLNIATTSSDISAVVNETAGSTELTLGVTNQMVKLATQQTLSNKTLLASDSNIVEATKLRSTPVSTTTPTNGQILKYNSTSGEWEPVDETEATGDPVFSKGSLSAPSVSFSGTRGSTSGIFHLETNTPPLDGVAVVQDGTRSALFSKAGVTIDGSAIVGNQIWIGSSRTTSSTNDIMLRATNTGLRGNSSRKSVTVKAGGRDVVEFGPNRMNLNCGMSMKIRTVIADEDLSFDDQVVLCSGNCDQVVLPQATASIGQLLIVAASGSGGSSISSTQPNASRIKVVGYSADGGTTRDKVDGLGDGITIGANETAMLLCDGTKWLRLGAIGTSGAGGAGSSTPNESVSWSKIMIDLNRPVGFSSNPTQVSYFDGLTFPNKNTVATTSAVSLKDSDNGTDTEVLFSGVKNGQLYQAAYGSSPYSELVYWFYNNYNGSDVFSARSSSLPYMLLENVPAGSYDVYATGGILGFSDYFPTVLVTEDSSITPSGSDIAYNDSDTSQTAQGKYLSGANVRVLGQLGAFDRSLKYSPSEPLQEGKDFVKASITVSSKQNIRIYFAHTVSTALPSALSAIYIRKN